MPDNPRQYRAYYDANGKVVTYTVEELEGNWIPVDAAQFAEARVDAVVVDGKLVTPHKVKMVSKLVRNVNGDYTSSKYDINIITDVDTVKWGLVHNVVKW